MRCIDKLPPGSFACPCSFPDASDCPLADQVCHNNTPAEPYTNCRTCGEPNTVVDQDKCKRGGTCTALLTCQ
jgi:hypothetical protein